jgi:uncharacterized protein YecE (DUF72 family)
MTHEQDGMPAGANAGPLWIGTAGWSVPRAVAAAFPTEGSGLQRYAARFAAAEINSTFHRSHRASTYARWADSVGAGFRFSVKLPKAITHGARLVACDPLIEAFAAEVAPLAAHRGPTLVQLPPSLGFEAPIAARFFEALTRLLGGPVACEPRHPSWFEPAAESLFAEHRVARVAADPARVPAAATPGGWPGLVYYRLHGSPRIYWSAYERDWLARLAGEVRRWREAGRECWVIFDNTAGSAAAANALELAELTV